MRRSTVLVALLAVVLFSVSGWAEEEKSPKIGIGAHLGWPTLIGPSVKAWVTPQFGIQGIASFFSVGDYSLTMLAGRGFFSPVKEEKKIFPYFGAGVGTWIASGSQLDYVYNPATGRTDWIWTDETETVFTFEIFLGFQHKYTEEFHADYEFGYYSINFDDVDVSVSGMAFSYAMHYYF